MSQGSKESICPAQGELSEYNRTLPRSALFFTLDLISLKRYDLFLCQEHRGRKFPESDTMHRSKLFSGIFLCAGIDSGEGWLIC